MRNTKSLLRALIAGLAVVALLGSTLGCNGNSNQRPPRQTPPPDDDDGADPQMTAEQMEEVQRTVNAGTTALKRCHEAEMAKANRKFKAGVTVKILIGTAGSVTEVVFVKSTLKSPEFEQCMRKTIMGWDMPRIPAAQWLTFPFTFEPAY